MNDLSRKDWDNDQPTDVDKWLAIYEQDDNLPWATQSGHLVNIIDELIWRLENAEKATEERIIKLLEDNAMTYNLVAINGEILKQTAPLAAPLDKVIELIKGENK